MKNKIIITIMTIFIFLTILNSVMAITYFQTKENIGNNTVKNRIWVYYSDIDGTTSFIKDGTPVEVYINYRAYLKTWNQLNTQNLVDSCQITIKFYSGINNLTTTVLQQNFSKDFDYENDKYFFRMNPKDSFSSELSCKYQLSIPITLEIPVDQSMESPTNACKSCQFYQWSIQERKIIKAETLGDRTVINFEYIKQLFIINFEILTVLFWIVLIVLLLASIGLIFFGLSYVAIWLFKVIEK